MTYLYCKEFLLYFQVLRRHLLHIFGYNFPEHYGEVLQAVLQGCSEKKLHPSVLTDLLLFIYKLAQCKELDLVQPTQTNEDLINFATSQQIFSFSILKETLELFAKHFKNDRLDYGLHGLYPKHKDLCEIISLLFKSMGYSLIVSAIHNYPGVLAEKCNIL